MAKRATALTSAAALVAMAVCAQAQGRSLVIAATTSIEDSGLFAHILPQFSARTGIAVRVVSRRRHPFMSNRFVIVGPQADPAGVRGMTDASKALREIARQRATFVSLATTPARTRRSSASGGPPGSIRRRAAAIGIARPASAWG